MVYDDLNVAINLLDISLLICKYKQVYGLENI